MRILDLTLHAWDLARSLGLDDGIDPNLALYLPDHQMHLVDDLRGLGLYRDDRSAQKSGAQSELLARTGKG